MLIAVRASLSRNDVGTADSVVQLQRERENWETVQEFCQLEYEGLPVRSSHRWWDNIKLNVSGVSEGVHCIRFPQKSFKRGNETLGSTKGEEFLDELNVSAFLR